MPLEELILNYRWFSLVFVRVAGIIGASPILGSRNFPNQVKLGFCLFAALILFPLIKVPAEPLPTDFFPFVIVVFGELALGLLMGYMVTLAFTIFQLAGQFIDVPMGFGMVNLLDPQTNLSLPIVGQFQHMLAVLLFLLMNGHHWLILALVRSFTLVPLAQAQYPVALLELVMRNFSLMFSLALQLAMPVVATLLLTDIALGIVARTVPQMNVFMVGFPAKIGVGLIILILILPVYASFLGELFGPNGQVWLGIGTLLRLWGGSNG